MGAKGVVMRAGYSSTIGKFLKDTNVVGCLSVASANYCVLRTQTQAWEKEDTMLKEALVSFEPTGHIYFEYDIPRMAKRADVVVLINGVLFVLEFKVDLGVDAENQGSFSLADCDQVSDYAHEFSYFHSESHFCPIVPILVDTGAKDLPEEDSLEVDDYNVYKVLRCNSKEKLISIITSALIQIPQEARLKDYAAWENGVYEPTPTIVEVAETVYAEHTVEEISRSGVGAQGIKNATNAINAIIKDAYENKKKVICFLTGVPGAGKTLVGINLVSARQDIEANRVFLSGNYPLVKVLQTALVRNRSNTIDLVKARMRAGEVEQLTENQKNSLAGLDIRVDGKPNRKGVYSVKGSIKKGELERQVKTKIQLVPNFRKEYDRTTTPPNEHVFIFDEAQRAWDAIQVKRKEKRTDGMSEPDILLSYLNRHQDWCVAVALVGTGQDIHNGEAGISEWYKALTAKFPDWEICLAAIDNSTEFDAMRETHKELIRLNPDLHLKHPMRSFRAQQISDFVEALLIGKKGLDSAKVLLQELLAKGDDGRVKFPIYLTRNLSCAKNKIKEMAKGSERYGILISSRAKRLRYYGLFSSGNEFDQVAWFLDGKTSINSSYSMEIAGWEFKVQGLEIDYAIVGWDGDYKYDNTSGKFVCQRFAPSKAKWIPLKDEKDEDDESESVETRCRHLINAYRVILTRARQGMILFVPTGDITGKDKTVLPETYDSTYEFLKSIGIPEL